MSKNQNNNTTSGGLGLSTVLTVIFVVLKLCGLIDWSWVWVLAPTWISIGLALVILLVLYVVLWIDERRWRK